MANTEQNSRGENRYKIAAFIVFILLVIFVAFYLIEGSEWGLSQVFGVLVSAAASGLITFLLLLGQAETQKKMSEERENWERKEREEQKNRDKLERESAEQREKNVKGYEQRVMAFSHFCENAWSNDLDEDGSKKYVETLQKGIFGTVLLYLGSSEVEQIAQIINGRESKNTSLILSSIVKILKDNVEKEHRVGEEKDGDFDKACKDLWEAFQNWAGDYSENQEDKIAEELVPANLSLDLEKLQPWHFIAKWATQFEVLPDLRELSLVEFGEGWRTALVRAVRPGDIVFLFRSGGYGYVGAFRAKGWRVFEYDQDQQLVVESTSEGIAGVIPAGKARIPDCRAILEKHDFYMSFGDGSTSCANVVVEPLVYVPEGVGIPAGGVYRRTISRYYRPYAAKLIEAFSEKDPSLMQRLH